jgi:hypothetical protein
MMEEDEVIPNWQPEATLTPETEPILPLVNYPLDLPSLRGRWYEAMKVTPLPDYMVCCNRPIALVDKLEADTAISEANPEWSGHIQPDGEVAIRVVGNVRCSKCGKLHTNFTSYERHTREQLEKEADWAVGV